MWGREKLVGLLGGVRGWWCGGGGWGAVLREFRKEGLFGILGGLILSCIFKFLLKGLVNYFSNNKG